MKLPKILPQPRRPESLPESAKWLSGEGAGSWFVFEELDAGIEIKRHSPKGVFECENVFETPPEFSFLDEFSMSYPSHCTLVTVIQNEKKIRFSVLRNVI